MVDGLHEEMLLGFVFMGGLDFGDCRKDLIIIVILFNGNSIQQNPIHH